MLCVLTGWGSTGTYGKGPYPNNLQEVNVTTVPYEDYHDEFPFITENNLCALASKGKGHGGCDGDSGGPLVDINRHVQVGVIIEVNGGGCAIGEPDFFSRTSAFYDWIQHNTKASGGECSMDDSGSNAGNPSNSGNPSISGNPGNPISTIFNWLQQKKP